MIQGNQLKPREQNNPFSEEKKPCLARGDKVFLSKKREWYTSTMKHVWIIAGIGFIILLGGVYFWFFRDTTPAEEVNIFSEDSLPKPVDEEGESMAKVLETMPKQPDFASITETIFLNEGVEEAKSFESRAVIPLDNLKRMAAQVKPLLEKREVNWCGPLVAFHQEAGVSNEIYLELLQEEREIRDVKFLSQAVQGGEEWSTWLVRLTEAADREGKKEEKAVENFQESFNDITDEYEETLYQTATDTREKIDEIIFSEQDITILPQNLLQVLEGDLEDEIKLCQEGNALTASQFTTTSRTLADWETRLETLLDKRERTMNGVLDVSTTSLSTLGAKTKNYTTRFEAAVVELRQTLQ